MPDAYGNMTEAERRMMGYAPQMQAAPGSNPVSMAPNTYTNGHKFAGTNVPMSDAAYRLLTSNGGQLATDKDVMGAGQFGLRGWMGDHPGGVIAAMIAAAAGGAALSGGLGAGAGGGVGGGVGGGTGGSIGGGGLTGSGIGAGEGIGAGAAAGAEGALPEIVVTGTTGGGIGAGTAAGVAGAGAAGSVYNGNSNQGWQNTSNPAGSFGSSQTGGNAGALANSGGIGGGAGVGGSGAGMASGSGGWLNWLGQNAGTIAGLAGGLAGSGTKNQRTTSTNEPPAYLLPYLQNAAQGSTALFGSGGPQYFPGATLAPQSQASQDALSGIIKRAQAGSPLVSTAQNYVQQGLQNPISSNLGNVTNPFASPIQTSTAANPYASPVGTDMSANPYASAVTSGTQAQNPYASAPNTFGGDTNPYLDSMFDHALQKAQSGVESQYQRAGRNIGASEPVMGDIASGLVSQIYAPAYESERNRQLQYQTQLNDIGSGAFENQQGRQLQSGLAAQGIGSSSIENSRSRQLQSGLQGQSIGANTYDQQQNQALQAGLQGQNIGAQGFENAQSRQLSDMSSQRGFMDSLLGYSSPLAAQDYYDLSQMQGAGAAQDFYGQQTIDDARARYDYGQNQPGQTMDDYIRRLTGLAGNYGTQTQNTPQYQNAGANALGYAMLLQQMQNSSGYGNTGGG